MSPTVETPAAEPTEPFVYLGHCEGCEYGMTLEGVKLVGEKSPPDEFEGPCPRCDNGNVVLFQRERSAAPSAEPNATVHLPDAVSLKMLENENAILRHRLDECRPYLKDGETPAQCIARNRADVDVALGLLAKEKQKSERAAPSSAGPDLRAIQQALLRVLEFNEGRKIQDQHTQDMTRMLRAVLALVDAKETK